MRTVIACTIALCILSGAQFAHSQGIKGFVERLDDIEKRLDAYEDENREIGELNEQLASRKVNGDTGEVEKELVTAIEKLADHVDSSEQQKLDQTLTLIITRLDDITRSLEETRYDVKNLERNVAGRENIREISASFAELRTAFDEMREAETVVPAVMVETTPVMPGTPSVAELDMDVSASYVSRYVWRGILLTRGAVIQPSATFAYGATSLNIWGNADISDVNGYASQFNELDYTLDHSFETGWFGISSGVIVYTFPNTGFDRTTELYLSLTPRNFDSMSVSVFQDVGEVNGTYLSLAQGASIPFIRGTSLDIGGALGWGSAMHNVSYYGVRESAVTDLSLSASIPVSVGSYFDVTPSIMYATLINGTIRDAFGKAGTDEDNFMFGLGFSRQF